MSGRDGAPIHAPVRLSIIICCHNGASRLASTLRHIAHQTGLGPDHWELIVVDNASEDGTAARARELWEGLGVPASLRVLSEPRLGVTHARRTGVAAARFDICSFVDDDNWICQDWAVRVLDLFTCHPAITVVVPYSEIAVDADVVVPPWFPALQHGYAIGPQAKVTGWVDATLPRFPTAGLSFRREALVSLYASGFSTLLSGRSGAQLSAGEDAEITAALAMRGHRFWYDDRVRFAHYMPAARLTVDYAKRLYFGLGIASVIEDHYHAFWRQRGPRPRSASLRDIAVLAYANALRKVLFYDIRALTGPRASARRSQAEIEASYFRGRLEGMRRYAKDRPAIVAHLSHWTGRA